METIKFHTSKAHFRIIFFLHLSGRIEQIYNYNEMSNVFNVVLINPIGY